MENTKSKITVNLYGKKLQAVMYSSDPSLDDLVDAIVGLLEEHDFHLKDIHEAFVDHLVSTMKESDEFKENGYLTSDNWKSFIKDEK